MNQLPHLLAPFALTSLLALSCSVDALNAPPAAGAGGAPPTTGGATSAGQPGDGAPAGGTAAGGGTAAAGTSASAGGSAGTTSGGQPSVGGAGNGGSVSGGATAGGTGGGVASGCVGVTSKLCDDFEAQTTGQPPQGDFSINGKAGSVIVDTSKAYSGTKALHITSAKPTSTAMLEFSKQFPLDDFHGRAMFFLTRIPTAEIHWDLIDSTSQNGVHWEIGGMYGKFILVVDPPDHGLTSNTFPTGKWFCLQWEFKYGGQGVDNTFLAKMDGSALDKGQFTGADAEGQKWNAGPWKNLSIGWTAYGSSEVDIEEWIDDLAISDAPVACPPPK